MRLCFVSYERVCKKTTKTPLTLFTAIFLFKSLCKPQSGEATFSKCPSLIRLIFRIFQFLLILHPPSSTSPPRGNQVDGLPRALHANHRQEYGMHSIVFWMSFRSIFFKFRWDEGKMNLGAPARMQLAFQPYRIEMYVVRSILLHLPVLADPSD